MKENYTIYLSLCALLLLLPIGAAPGGTGETQKFRAPAERYLYVDDSGGSTFTSIQDAVDHAVPHTTIIVNPGSYDRVCIRDLTDLTIQGNGSVSDDVVISAGLASTPSVSISDSSNITLRKVTTSLAYASPSMSVTHSSNVSIVETKCSNIGGGLYIRQSQDVTLVGSSFYGSLGMDVYRSMRVKGIFVKVDAYSVNSDRTRGISIRNSRDVSFGYLLINITGANSTFIRGEDCWNVTFDSIGGSFDNLFATLLSGELRLINIDLPDRYFSIYSGARLTMEFPRFIFIRDESNTTSVEGADMLLTADGNVMYSTEHYGGSDRKSDTNGRFYVYTLKRLFEGSSTSIYPVNSFSVWYGGGDVEREVFIPRVNTNESSTIYVLLPDFEAPEPPENVTATALDENTVQISFDESNSTDVVAYRIYSNRTGEWEEILNTTRAGDFLIENLEGGQTYWFKVVAVDDAGIESVGVFVNVTTPPPTKGTLSGWVLYRGGPLDGQNASSASVTLYNSTHQEVASAVLGEDGRFTFHNIPFADGYLLEITPPGAVVYGGNRSGYLTWRGLINFTEAREITVFLMYYEYVPPAEGDLLGKLTYSGGPLDGEGAEGAAVEIYSGNTLVTSTTTDENGTFLIENLSFGPYRVVVTPPGAVEEGGNRSGYVRVEVELNFTEDCSIQITVPYYTYSPPPPPRHPKVRIVDEDGEGVEGVTVKADVNGTVYTATTDENGWATFTGFEGDFPPGVEFTAEKEGYEKISWSGGENPPPLKKEEKKGGGDYLYLLFLLVMILLLIGAVLLLKKKGQVEEE